MQMTAIVNRLATDARATLVGSGPRAFTSQIGTFRLCLTRLRVKLVLIDWTFGNSTRAFFTVAS
jgi:hypothetical protein